MATPGNADNPNPAFPPEMVHMILKYLDVRDLLNCRSVCQDWNKLCLKHLSKKSWVAQRLSSEKLSEFVNFIKETGPQIVSPFHLSIICEDEEGVNLDLNAIELNLDYLSQSRRGSESIVALRVELPSNRLKDRAFVSILKKLSPELLSLELTVHGPYSEVEDEDVPAEFVAGLRGELDLLFPKLTKLTCYSSYDHDRDEWDFYSVLVGRCPELQHFEFSGKLDQYNDAVIRIPQRNLRHLKLFGLADCIPLYNQVRTIEVDGNGQPIHPSVLETFIHDSGVSPTEDDANRAAHRNAMAGILSRFSSSLKHLSCYLLDDKDNPHVSLPAFPVMPALESLKFLADFELIDTTLPIHLNAAEIHFTPEFLPVLNRVTMPIGLLWDGTRPAGVFSGKNSNNTFSTVTTLIFQVPDGNDEYLADNFDIGSLSAETVKATLDHSFAIFPNVRVLELSGKGSLAGFYMKRVVNQIICHPFAGAALQELTISDYKRDYLGEKLCQLDFPPSSSLTLRNFPATLTRTKLADAIGNLFRELGVDLDVLAIHDQGDPGHRTLSSELVQTEPVLKNIRKLTLLKQSDYEPALVLDYLDTSEQPPLASTGTLHLSTLAKHLPSLRMLEFSKNILSNSPNSNTAWETAREIEKRFINWTVRIV